LNGVGISDVGIVSTGPQSDEGSIVVSIGLTNDEEEWSTVVVAVLSRSLSGAGMMVMGGVCGSELFRREFSGDDPDEVDAWLCERLRPLALPKARITDLRCFLTTRSVLEAPMLRKSD
jgi:hypothetical protein